MTHSTASAIRGFFERLTPQKNSTVAKVIADSFHVKQESFELYVLLEVQRDNFSRLLKQIELSSAGTRAKQISTNQIQKLGQFVSYNTMHKTFEPIRIELIAPNLEALTYAEEFLGIAQQAENTLPDDIREVSKHLEAALEEVRVSSLPLICEPIWTNR